jgi:hypothetical protein
MPAAVVPLRRAHLHIHPLTHSYRVVQYPNVFNLVITLRDDTRNTIYPPQLYIT